MICAVIPAHNEAGRVNNVLRNISLLPVDHIIFVANGCRDATIREAMRLQLPNLHLIYFQKPLGIDIPRAAGAKIAQLMRSDITMFVDGDMTGSFTDQLRELIDAMRFKQLDLGLTDCYPILPDNIDRCNPTFKWRQAVNRELGIPSIGLATPSHGPHAVSKRLLDTLPLRELAIPPVVLALAKKQRLNIGIGTTIPHYALGSTVKSSRHSKKIIDTIIGDCIEAIAVFKNQPRLRSWQNVNYLGYNNDRRFDLLEEFIARLS